MLHVLTATLGHCAAYTYKEGRIKQHCVESIEPERSREETQVSLKIRYRLTKPSGVVEHVEDIALWSAATLILFCLSRLKSDS